MALIDVHCHLGAWNFPIPGRGTVDSLLRLCDRYDIRWAICSSTQAIVYDMVRGNAWMAEQIARTDRLLGYVVCDPNDIEASVREMEAYLPTDKFVGIKIHPSYARCDPSHPRMAELFAEIARRARAVLIHTFSAQAARAVAEYARRYPDLQIILAHAGGPQTEGAAAAVAGLPNVYLDFCCSHSFRGRLERALELVGPTQLVYGSDMDLLDPAFTLGMFEDAGLTDEQKRMAYWDNAARIFRLAE